MIHVYELKNGRRIMNWTDDVVALFEAIVYVEYHRGPSVVLAEGPDQAPAQIADVADLHAIGFSTRAISCEEKDGEWFTTIGPQRPRRPQVTARTSAMTDEHVRRLHELCLLVTAGDLRRPWSVQTSNSFRRIGTDRGDGDVLCAVTQRSDGHPDLLAAPGVLDYIVAAHPFVVLELIDQRDRARHAVDYLRRKITGHDDAFAAAEAIAGALAERHLATPQRTP